MDGVWTEMEEDFKAKQLVINLMAKQKHAELRSVLDPQTKKRVAAHLALEILIQLIRKLEPEEIARKIEQFDLEMCTQVFLRELKPVLPSPEQVGKLNVYRNADPAELASLHPSDRLMVQLIKINRLGPRIEGMLYRVSFDETWALLDEGARKLSEAGRDLLEAKHFKELLSLILLIGNYMNGTGIKGGAFGFRVSSINKLVDTKSVNNTTLLHFLERTVTKHFPDMEVFLEELERPSEAYRVNLQDIRKGLTDLRDGLSRIHQELREHFTELDEGDLYGKQMWAFYKKAHTQLEDLVDDVRNADSTFIDAISYYGEDDKSMTSSEFYGIFKTFVTSYKASTKCKAENQAAAEERLALARRKQALEVTKASRQKDGASIADEDDGALERLIADLRNGEVITRKARRRRSGTQNQIVSSQTEVDSLSVEDTRFIAKDMLARLQSDGFVAPPSPTMPNQQRRRRRRTERSEADQDLPTSSEMMDFTEISTTDTPSE
ncbi:hypothetical protein CVT26_005206 [Gymnopilus dilepis]|uniref:FH2 domain-containing protein n=1 Tax=Gymnopilus dilepis TaxID=231916 RepID=A0A409WZ79_9AGAR|nr:hypothetical protein CVT26_005206 [Gymnopilus dilepis]